MQIELPLDQMSVEEKLRLMDVLWADLASNPEVLPMPDWHKEVLDECRRRAESGEEKFIEWEEAKKQILRMVHDSRSS